LLFGTNDDWFAATSTTAGGYQVEFKVKKSALRDPPDGATLGFHIAVNDDDGDSTLAACCGGTGTGRKSQVGWTGHAHNEYIYGSLTLLASSLPPPGGKLTIEGIKVNGDKLEFSITNPSTTGTHSGSADLDDCVADMDRRTKRHFVERTGRCHRGHVR